ncbi:hypothetical protein Gotri_004326, partial [Gossypium trilobum]|nr:hypothetical protein [Gossypium trilobum]
MTESLKANYEVCEEIGRGRFGIVFRCVSLISGESFAVKSIDKRIISAGDSLDSQCLFNEPKILTLVSPHPNIIHLHHLYEDDSHLHMVLDLCPPSRDLYNLIIDNGQFSEALARPILTQLVQALAHIHSLGVVHRDIKPENILFDSKNSVKLTDFGSADVAPEVMRGVVGTPVFQSVSPAAKDLLRKMLCKDVSRRLSAEQDIHGSQVDAEFLKFLIWYLLMI